jgi:hypothetical protein
LGENALSYMILWVRQLFVVPADQARATPGILGGSNRRHADPHSNGSNGVFFSIATFCNLFDAIVPFSFLALSLRFRHPHRIQRFLQSRFR